MMTSSSSGALSLKRLEGKVAIITGGVSGIGESTTRLFVKYGAKVVIADIQDELGHSLVKDITSNSKQEEAISISYVHWDVTKESDVENAVNTAISKYGKLDIMFSNAGIVGEEVNESILLANYDNFRRVFDVNVFGAFMCAKHAARVMIPAKKGSIIFTSSIASVICTADVSNTDLASKHAVVGLTKNLSVELGEHGIRVNSLSPYGVATPLAIKSLGLDKKRIEEVVSDAANLKRVILKADDVAEAAVFLGSDESNYISGVNLVIDGGYSITNGALKNQFKKNFLPTQGCDY